MEFQSITVEDPEAAKLARDRYMQAARRVRAMIADGRFPRAYKLEGTDVWLIHSGDFERADVTERKPGRPAKKASK